MTQQGFSHKIEEERQANFQSPRPVSKNEIYIPKNIEERLKDVVLYMNSAEDFGSDMGYRGVLFTGPPGCGKTLTARFVSGMIDADVSSVKTVATQDFVSKLFRGLRNRVEKTDRLQLVIMDEIDKLSKRDSFMGMSNPEREIALKQFLEELDGIENNYKIIFLGLTNQPNALDYALRRPGRFGVEIPFTLPDEQGRLEILKIHAYNLHENALKASGNGRKGHKFNVKEDDLEWLAGNTYGFSGDDLKGVLMDAFVKTLKDKRYDVTREDVEKARQLKRPTSFVDLSFREPKKDFSMFGGLDDHIALIKHVIDKDFFKEGKGYNMLFHGASGTGKSAFAEAIAKHYGYNFVSIDGSSLMNSLVGETEKAIENVISRCEVSAPTVLLFDEFDSLMKTRGYAGFKVTWAGKLRARLNTPLNGVILVATLNDINVLEDSTIRRFNYVLGFEKPDFSGLTKVWECYASDLGLKPDVWKKDGLEDSYETQRDLEDHWSVYHDFAARSVGLTGAKVEQICARVERYKDKIKDPLDAICDMINLERGMGDSKEQPDHIKEYRLMRRYFAEK